jgi:hypothetical protein
MAASYLAAALFLVAVPQERDVATEPGYRQ